MFYQCSRSKLIKRKYEKSKIYVDRKCCKWCIIHIRFFNPNTILGPDIEIEDKEGLGAMNIQLDVVLKRIFISKVEEKYL